jgi:hypothetical protein
LLDVLRVRSDDDHTTPAATQLRAVVDMLITAGHWHEGDPEIWIIGDSGYDGLRLTFLLADLPAQLLVRMRSDRCWLPPRHPDAPARSAAGYGTEQVRIQRSPDLADSRSSDVASGRI